MPYRVIVPPPVEKILSTFHPLLKRRIRAALDALKADPFQGKALGEELAGFFSYRVSRHRVVYRIVGNSGEVRVVAIGPRKSIYQSL